MENWRKYLAEDAARRGALAQDIRDMQDQDRWDTEPAEAFQFGRRYDKEALPKKYGKMMTQGRAIKKLFRKHADRSFLKSLGLVHWGWKSDIKDLLLQGSSKDELSAMAFLPGQLKKSSFGDVGLIVKGHISLLANDMDKLMTGAGRRYTEADPERTKMSGANKGVQRNFPPEMYEKGRPLLVLDKEDWEPKGRETLGNEALVDNWKPIGIIALDPDEIQLFETIVEQRGLNIPVMSFEEADKKL